MYYRTFIRHILVLITPAVCFPRNSFHRHEHRVEVTNAPPVRPSTLSRDTTTVRMESTYTNVPYVLGQSGNTKDAENLSPRNAGRNYNQYTASTITSICLNYN